MDDRLAVMMELEKALNKFEGANLYSAGLAFFSALGYPVEPLKTAINESMFRFVYIISQNRCVLSREESYAMESVANISWLFALHHDANLWKGIQVAPVDDTPILCINYFCVEMVCSWRERSMMAVTLTKIISKVVNTSVVVLFKHANQLLLSSAHMTIGKNQSSLRTYLSDWYVIDPIQEKVLKALSEWYCVYFSNDSLDDFFVDGIALTARPYFLNRVRDNYAGQNLKKADPRYSYGYDYISVEECFEVVDNNDDWVIKDMINLLEESAVASDVQERFKPPASDQIEHSGPDIKGIDEDIFSDPIKLLNYLESQEEKT